MGMTIEELITFCEEEEHGCRVRCKRYDDASGFTRSKDKNIRTADAITEEVYADFYKEISDIMHKYQKIDEIYQKWNEVNDFTYNQAMQEIGKVIESEEIPND